MGEKKDKKLNKEELLKKLGIDLEKLKQEQLKIAKEIEIKDKIDFSLAERFGGIDNTFIGNKLLTCIIVCNKEFEIIDRAYSFERVKFPYIPGFRNYRELPVMMEAFGKLSEKPDVVFIPAHGITHPRLGLASHFALSTGVPSIGVSNSIIEADIEGDDVLRDGKKIGRLLSIKPGSKPMYISPGSFITINSVIEVSKKLINLPHKRPEPLHIASKYAKRVREELEL